MFPIQMKKNNLFLYLLLSAITLPVFRTQAQDDLLKQLEKQTSAKPEKVIATFKGLKVVNMESSETIKKKNLDFRVSHLFGNVGKESGGGFHTLWGLDNSADIRIAFHYGITDRLNVGFARHKRDENLVGEIKYKLLEQTENNKMPVTATLFGNMTYTPKVDPVLDENGAYRITYLAQVLVARKFSSRISAELVSSFLHRNLVYSGDENDVFSLGIGARWKFTRSAAFVLDYNYAFGRPDSINIGSAPTELTDPLAMGLEIETGGHVFTVFVSNASGKLENDFIASTTDKWSDGGYKIGFHISRVFRMGKKK
jgi:hypothetical protein